MSTFTYEIADVSPQALWHALFQTGVTDATISVDASTVVVNTAIGTEPQCEAIALLCVEGQLYANKWQKVRQFQENTRNLLAVPVPVTVGGVNDFILLTDGFTEFAFYSSLQYETGAAINLITPPLVLPTQHCGLACATPADVVAFVNAIRARLLYLIIDGTINADGSKSEGMLLQAIIAAADQSELDAITDTRV